MPPFAAERNSALAATPAAGKQPEPAKQKSRRDEISPGLDDDQPVSVDCPFAWER